LLKRTLYHCDDDNRALYFESEVQKKDNKNFYEQSLYKRYNDKRENVQEEKKDLRIGMTDLTRISQSSSWGQTRKVVVVRTLPHQMQSKAWVENGRSLSHTNLER
jgi:hypothetical protein